MLEKIIEIFALVWKKYSVQSVISATIAIWVYSITDENYWLLQKLGKWLYILLVFLALLSAITLSILVYKNLRELLYKYRLRKEHLATERREDCEELLDFVDSLDNRERKLIDRFLKNSNTPLTMAGHFMHDAFIDSYCDKNEIVIENEELTPVDYYNLEEEEQTLKRGDFATRFKLRRDLYEALVWLEQTNGNISRF